MNGATALSERALGPDLARGLMLWFIALANSQLFLEAAALGSFPHTLGWLDQATMWVLTTFVNAHAYPLFGFLFGYGVTQVARRHAERGRRRVRRLLWRRAGALLLIGSVHTVLLFSGDVLAGYGVTLLVGAFVVFWRDGWVIGWAIFFFLLVTAGIGAVSVEDVEAGVYAADVPGDIETLLTERLITLPLNLIAGPFMATCPFLLGLWAGRRRLLERTGRGLKAVAVSGIAIGVVGAQPLALMWIGVLPSESDGWYGLATTLDVAAGVIGGVGYAAAFALLAPRLRQGRVVRALTATGQRSMTCYLAQSVVWTLVFTPFLLGLHDELSLTATALLATATWLATVALASWMARTGRRGPFEVLLRRATYGRASLAPWRASSVGSS
ncbi:DUF418 domain-containing protein [Solirubrobacter phytolaccae]|uniref:DUF418 domain-containing protein n=1 Tax=Solirubrobacter phytolaccae TaxID=1404360 RepID=A0A9X3NEP1_9ACTN|nr:DUF418 domain-containing protein [Solirubrobacter phytolaccae]MDA0185335.1 DUF418 domain-containing protein [Solirubrobacter phytolaccae]